MCLLICEVTNLEDSELENLIENIISLFDLNDGVLYFEDIVNEFYPEIEEDDLKYAILTMFESGEITTDGNVLRLIDC
jgi:hypothetical protein